MTTASSHDHGMAIGDKVIQHVRFSFDGDSAVFTAAGVADSWNGWLVPVVDRATLGAVIARLNERDEERTTELVDLHDASVVVYEFSWDNECRELVNEMQLTPDADGNYRLDLGLTLAAVQ
ncbi:hypothetical protein [Mycobacterium intracellulare]|uniref:Uncharacterized protein n=2 Tax=Mycobacterium avium complex (MAC) TaxID=120793 RepID=A0ABT7P889_MYCIT|nr:hypothetical protein [Mycobacterium intracellulare]MDM3929273.1 hypothetical protein [Mycobacterium intracellulare subsp. chimaera]